MPSSLAGLLGAFALAAAGFPAALGRTLIWIPVCHGNAIPVELPDGSRRGRDDSCPGGCHAACLSRTDALASDDEDSA
jgi:hypothetical protein